VGEGINLKTPKIGRCQVPQKFKLIVNKKQKKCIRAELKEFNER